jgi:hypothetical protein
MRLQMMAKISRPSQINLQLTLVECGTARKERLQPGIGRSKVIVHAKHSLVEAVVGVAAGSHVGREQPGEGCWVLENRLWSVVAMLQW